jgi:hypothetical protein
VGAVTYDYPEWFVDGDLVVVVLLVAIGCCLVMLS